jgi:hypothetical protein
MWQERVLVSGIVLALALFLASSGTQAAPYAHGLSTAVYLSDGTKFPGWNQWSRRDGGWIDSAKWVAGDFNGDKQSELATIWNNRGNNTLTVSQANNSRFTRTHWATNAGGWVETTAWLSGDFNGDGKTDIAASWNDGGLLSTAVYLSDGTKFPGWTQWSQRDGGWIDSAKWVAGDFNGDGKDDIAAIWNNGNSNTLTVSLSTGSGFTRTHWATNAGGWAETTAWLAGDFNGDGKDDIAASWNDQGQLSTAVYLSDGTKFPGWTQWSQRDGGWIDAPNAKWVAGDFNGDGKDDIAAIWNNGGSNTLTVSQSTGSSFTRGHWATNAGGWLDTTAWRAGDFNGDGKTDIAAAWDDADPIPEHLRPGTHTVSLDVSLTFTAVDEAVFHGCGSHPGAFRLLAGLVGFGQAELSDSSRCGAWIAHLAVQFEKGPLDKVPHKTITRAVLTYDEAPAEICPLVSTQFSPCWSDGDGNEEVKPDGCVIVRLPTWDWRTPIPEGLIPFSHNPLPPVVRLGTREWDVTQPYKIQTETYTFGEQPVAGKGFLLTGWPESLDDLTGDDNTVCFSKVTNIQLHVTYTVPPPGTGELPIVR